jgi:MoxR-like ATPase
VSAAPTIQTPAADAGALERVLFEIKRVIVGQERMVERMMVGLLARGHCLLEGVPGVAKTLAVETLAKTVSGSFSRMQFTPDLVPSDIVGTRIYRAGSERFDTELGPIMANFVLADEINRAPAKVQSALLEVMAERQVTIGGIRYPVPSPFLVLATQNPIESEGVYPLPEAQRDRFLMKINVDYPTAAEEREIVYRMGVRPPVASAVISTDELERLQATASRVFVHHAIVDYVVRLVVATRHPEQYGLTDVASWIAYGASPRASLGLIAAGRALALLRGRDYVLPQDVLDIATDVLPHRMVLSYDAIADGIPAVHAVRRVLQTVPLPQVAPRQRSAGPYGASPQAAQRGYPTPSPQQQAPQQQVPQPNPTTQFPQWSPQQLNQPPRPPAPLVYGTAPSIQPQPTPAPSAPQHAGPVELAKAPESTGTTPPPSPSTAPTQAGERSPSNPWDAPL